MLNWLLRKPNEKITEYIMNNTEPKQLEHLPCMKLIKAQFLGNHTVPQYPLRMNDFWAESQYWSQSMCSSKQTNKHQNKTTKRESWTYYYSRGNIENLISLIFIYLFWFPAFRWQRLVSFLQIVMLGSLLCLTPVLIYIVSAVVLIKICNTLIQSPGQQAHMSGHWGASKIV